jgi:hypothetical protein
VEKEEEERANGFLMALSVVEATEGGNGGGSEGRVKAKRERKVPSDMRQFEKRCQTVDPFFERREKERTEKMCFFKRRPLFRPNPY